MSDAPRVGIDLGTTHCVVSVFEGTTPRLLDSPFGRPLVPSCVAMQEDGTIIVGDPAKERLARGAAHSIARFKPSMGEDRTWYLGKRRLDATALSALLLRDLRRGAEASLGVPVTEAVVSVPAWFREPQRRATVEAASMAGLETLRLINEPTAAALAYGLHEDGEPRTVAVLDLGGGTFDVTVLELFDGVFDVRSSAGDSNLGGEDVTDAVLEWALKRGGVLRPSAEQAAVWREAVDAGKRRLAEVERTELRLSRPVILDRAELQRLSAPFLSRMSRCVREALVQAEMRPGDIDEVVLVGGATRMTAVQELAADLFRRDSRASLDVDTIVARGAAIQAALVAGDEAVAERLATDVLTHSLGIAVLVIAGDEHFPDRFRPILHRGTTLPCSRREQFQAVGDEQTEVMIRVYEGEHREVDRNHLLGTLELTGMRPRKDVPEEGFDVRFSHDVSGLLEVEAKAHRSDATAAAHFGRRGRSFTDEEVGRIADSMASLKVHPRDLLPNRWLLERATRLVELLAGTRREHVDAMLTNFEAALESEQPERIAASRARLKALVKSISAEFELEFLE